MNPDSFKGEPDSTVAAGNGHRQPSEEEIAQLAGIAAKAGPVPSEPVDLAAELEESESDGEEEAELPKTGALWNNPLVKAGAVGTGLGVVFLFGGLLVMGGNYAPKAAPAPVAQAAPKAEEPPEDPTGNLKTEAALGKQDDQIKDIGGSGASTTTASKPASPPVRVLPPPPAPTAPLAPAPPAYPQAPPVTATANVSTDQQKPQMAQGQALSLSGSYGAIRHAQYSARVPERASASMAGGSRVPPPQETADAPTQFASAEVPVLRGRLARQLLVSSTAEGEIVNPLVAEGNQISEGSLQQQATVRLSTDLLFDDNTVALPAGTEIVARLKGVSSNGFVLMVATTVLQSVDGRRLATDLPADAIWVQGSQGRPLIANNLNDRGPEYASQDFGQAAAAAAQKGAQLFNRATSQSMFSGAGGVGASVQYPPINLIAGIIEGGAGAVSGNLASRSQQAIAAAAARANIWFLAAKTPVQIVVNKTVELER
ncbi:hypothetical protein ISF26_23740 (plasmid) [Gloeobacter morelensis MG652769]|nr:hypothetical protein ISF26_23740 [Gloeobacter morelensis MG652769]